MTTKTLDAVMAEIDQAAEGALHEVRYLETAAAGDVIRQGDVYLVRVAKTSTERVRGGPWRGGAQVADGASVGARHIAMGPGLRLVEVAPYEIPGVDRTALFGPLVEAEGRWALTHPEHADCSLPAGCWQVLYQSDPRTRRAVMD